MKSIDLTGERFGKWTVVEKSERPITSSPSKPLYWKCKCDCGNEGIVPSHSLRCHKSESCGCTKKLPSYMALYNFLLRASNISNKACELTFEDFVHFTSTTKCHYCNAPIQWIEHNLRCGKSYHLDRMNNSIGYTKNNCVVCCTRCNLSKGDRYTYSEWHLMTECFRNRKIEAVKK
jgi:hypothetical protein